MLTQSPNCDRRAHRSPWPSAALALQLARSAKRHGLDLIVLADSGGNLWAASSLDPRAEALAADLPRIYVEPPDHRSSRSPDGQRALLVRALRVGAADLYLAAQGPRGAVAVDEAGVDEATAGVQRILAALCN